MAYKLIGSVRSPFVRACRMLMIQQDIPFDFQVLDFVNDAADAKALTKETPINKVPLLVDGSQKIFDSRVIYKYLSRKHQIPELSIDEENTLSVIYGAMDAGVILFLMRRDGFSLEQESFFLSRNKARIPEALSYLLPWVKSLDSDQPRDWNFVSMMLYSFLYWGQAREVLKVETLDTIYTQFLENFKKAPGVSETHF